MGKRNPRPTRYGLLSVGRPVGDRTGRPSGDQLWDHPADVRDLEGYACIIVHLAGLEKVRN